MLNLSFVAQRWLLACAWLPIVLLSACAPVIPASHLQATMQKHATPASSPAAQAAGVPVGIPSREWWRDLGDSRLDALVQQAQSNNHDARAALASLQAARAQADAAARESLPQGSLAAHAQLQRPSLIEVDPYRQGLPRPPQQRIASVTQGLGWEIDLFGRIDTATGVAQRRADVAAAELHAALALLQAEVAGHYIQLRQQQALIEYQIEALRMGNLHATQLAAREMAGLMDRREVLEAERLQTSRETEYMQMLANEQAHLAALAVLTGHSPISPPADWLNMLAAAPLPDPPTGLFLNRPDDLLMRRPDVRRADALLRAQLGEAVLAERAHLPHLRLEMSAGLNAPFGTLGEAGALRYALGPVLQWDWLDSGRNQARSEAARAGADAAWHDFEQTVLKALQDSESALWQWNVAQSAFASAHLSEQLAQRNASYADTRTKAGLEPPQASLHQSLLLLEARKGLKTAEADRLLAFAKVQLAMGAWAPR